MREGKGCGLVCTMTEITSFCWKRYKSIARFVYSFSSRDGKNRNPHDESRESIDATNQSNKATNGIGLRFEKGSFIRKKRAWKQQHNKKTKERSKLHYKASPSPLLRRPSKPFLTLKARLFICHLLSNCISIVVRGLERPQIELFPKFRVINFVFTLRWVRKR